MFGFGKRALIETETGAWLGFVELSQVGPGRAHATTTSSSATSSSPTRWGEGIATEAALATRDEAFERCGINELIGRCRVENVASARVLAKVGFRSASALLARRRHHRRDPPDRARRLGRCRTPAAKRGRDSTTPAGTELRETG